MKTRLFQYCLLAVLFSGCTEPDDLRESVFIRDVQYPQLPQYSEWGYNTFGSFFNEDVFVSNGREAASLIQVDSTMLFTLNGEIRKHDGDTSDMYMTFTLGYHLKSRKDFILSLNDSLIDLKDPACKVYLRYGYPTADTVSLQDGYLHFKRIQALYVDNDPEGTILSGIFEFSGSLRGAPLEVTHGRFDISLEEYIY